MSKMVRAHTKSQYFQAELDRTFEVVAEVFKYHPHISLERQGVRYLAGWWRHTSPGPSVLLSGPSVLLSVECLAVSQETEKGTVVEISGYLDGFNIDAILKTVERYFASPQETRTDLLTCCRAGHARDGCECSRCGTPAHVLGGYQCYCYRCHTIVHTWNGCQCFKCGSSHPELSKHAWDGCKCSTCGMTRDAEHAWDGCLCTKEARQNNLSISLPNVLRLALCRTQQARPLQQSLSS